MAVTGLPQYPSGNVSLQLGWLQQYITSRIIYPPSSFCSLILSPFINCWTWTKRISRIKIIIAVLQRISRLTYVARTREFKPQLWYENNVFLSVSAFQQEENIKTIAILSIQTLISLGRNSLHSFITSLIHSSNSS